SSELRRSLCIERETVAFRKSFQLRQMGTGLLFKASHFLFGNRCRLGEFDRGRVFMNTVDPELVMQVRAGGQAAGADSTDHLALFNASPYANAFGEAMHVGIQRGNRLAVLDDHHIAITTFDAGKNHLAVTCRLNRRPGGGCIVGALMSADSVQYRMFTGQVEMR